MRPRQHFSWGFLRHQLLTATVVKGGHAEAFVESLEKVWSSGLKVLHLHIPCRYTIVRVYNRPKGINLCGIDKRQSS